MSRKIRIELISDTSTLPTRAMRAAMAEAEVGDEQRGEDPTVNTLCERVADLVGKEAALFLPSGTMCNQIAIAVHCRPGDEVIAAENAHIIEYEGAGAAVLAGSFVRGIPAPNGIFSRADVEAAIRLRRRKIPRTRLVEIEQTNNYGGGSIWPLKAIEDVAAAVRQHDLALHMDGARLMNAVVASGVPASKFAASCGSVWLDLSKGLGCPVGGVLAGSADFITEASVWKHRLGGAMRQAGIIAAAGVYALDHNVDRLAEDHENARLFAEKISHLPGIKLVSEKIETNIVFFDVEGTGQSAAEISDKLIAKGIRIGADGPYCLRAVTHLDVTRKDVVETADTLAEML